MHMYGGSNIVEVSLYKVSSIDLLQERYPPTRSLQFDRYISNLHKTNWPNKDNVTFACYAFFTFAYMYFKALTNKQGNEQSHTTENYSFFTHPP